MRHPHLTPSLVAIAHGSRDPRAGATVAELLALARARASARGLAGLEARGAFLGHAPPAPLQVLTALAGAGGGERDVVVLPLLLTAAYHSGTDIPELLAEAAAGLPGLRIRYGEPLGPHAGLVRALERRLAEAGQDPGADPARTAVVLASAGSSHPAANASIAAIASGWQAARGWLAVRPAYASAAAPAPARGRGGPPAGRRAARRGRQLPAGARAVRRPDPRLLPGRGRDGRLGAARGRGRGRGRAARPLRAGRRGRAGPGSNRRPALSRRGFPHGKRPDQGGFPRGGKHSSVTS